MSRGISLFCPILCVADVDPAVFQRLFLVDLLLRRRRLPRGENVRRNQVLITPAPTSHRLIITRSTKL